MVVPSNKLRAVLRAKDQLPLTRPVLRRCHNVQARSRLLERKAGHGNAIKKRKEMKPARKLLSVEKADNSARRKRNAMVAGAPLVEMHRVEVGGSNPLYHEHLKPQVIRSQELIQRPVSGN